MRAESDRRAVRRLGHGWAPDAIDSTPIAKRRLRVLSAMFAALEKQGCQIKPERDLIRAVYAEVPLHVAWKARASL